MADARLRVMMPVYDDWTSAVAVVRALDSALADAGRGASVVLVDDGSSQPLPPPDAFGALSAITGVQVIELRRNLGHQRAIAVGLAFIEAHLPCDAVVVMDSDGEDAPQDVPRLVAGLGEVKPRPIVFARRAKRSEGRSFRLFYYLYRMAYGVLVGREIRVGNFSVIPAEQLRRVVVLSEIWNHYASGVHKARLPTNGLTVNRAQRIAGQSKMTFASLVMHGLSAIAVYADVVSARALVASLAIMVAACFVIAVVLTMKLVLHMATPGWATEVIASTVVIVLQTTMFSMLFAFLQLSSRSASGFVPSRDYAVFVLGARSLLGADPGSNSLPAGGELAPAADRAPLPVREPT